MSEHADGSIIVDTEIDTQGFEADSAKLQKAIQSLNRKMETLGSTFKKAVSGNSNAIASFEDKAGDLESKIADIQQKMNRLGSAKVPTESYAQLSKEAQKAEQELLKLYNRQEKMEAIGVKTDSQSWRALQFDIQKAEENLARFERQKSEMQAKGTAFQLGSQTDTYKQMQNELEAARKQLETMRATIKSANAETSKFASAAQRIKAAFSGIGKVGETGFKTVFKALKQGVSWLNNIRKSSNGASKSVGGVTKSLSFLGDMFKFMITQKLLSAIVTGAKEGMDNLAQYSGRFNTTLSTLLSGLTQLKNSLATAFAPILTAVTPALSQLINYLSTAITYVGKLIAALTGATTFTKAIAVQQDYAASLDKTSEAAKKAKKSLTGFDEINALSDNSAGSTGAAGSVSPSEMFEEVPIESSILNFIKRIKAAFRAGDYDEIGQILGDGINSAVQKMNSRIRWDSVGEKVTETVKGVASGFNSLIYTVNWTMIGDTMAQGLNTVLYTLLLLVTEFDWAGLSAAFAQGLNGLVTGIDWGAIGTLLSTSLITALSVLRTAISTFDWAALGSGIAEAFNNIDWVGVFGELAGLISDALTGALDLILGIFRTLDWAQLGTDLWNSLVAIVENINWGDILAKLIEGISTIQYGLGAAVLGLLTGLWESLKEAWNSLKEYYKEHIEAAGGNVIQGWLNGVLDGFKNIGTWIKDNILTPWLNGFKNAFGIHSPSTVMEEQGGFVIKGLFNGISNAWSTITEFFNQKLPELKTTLNESWTNIKTDASEAWGKIKTTVSEKWNAVKDSISSNNEKIRSNVSSSWSNLKTTISTKLSNISSSASSTFTNLKNSASTWGKDLCTNMANGIRNATGKVSSAVSNVASKIKSLLGFSEPEEGPLSDFHTYMPDMIDLMVLGIRKNQKSAIGAVSEMAGAISKEIQSGDYSFGEAGFEDAFSVNLDSFSDKIVNGFYELLSRLQSIAENISFTAPAVSTGTVIPYLVGAKTQTQAASDNAADAVAEQLKQRLSAENAEQNALLREQNAILRQLLAKDNTAVISAGEIQTALKSKNQRGGSTALAVAE